MRNRGRSCWGPAFDRLLRHMKQLQPFTFRAVQRIVFEGDVCEGICEERDGTYIIRVIKSLNRCKAEACLVHEVAHALDIARNGWPTEMHGDSWGVEYARAYRHWMEFLNLEEQRDENG